MPAGTPHLARARQAKARRADFPVNFVAVARTTKTCQFVPTEDREESFAEPANARNVGSHASTVQRLKWCNVTRDVMGSELSLNLGNMPMFPHPVRLHKVSLICTALVMRPLRLQFLTHMNQRFLSVRLWRSQNEDLPSRHKYMHLR